ncbi:MAG: DUF433 domain-containing protein [Xanthobacteraceae bacterium]|nr:DUF433 domain-containing protein [Xanthobacteraceae bacterium]
MASVPKLFTTAEAAVLAETPPAAVEKAVEEGIIEIRKAQLTKVSSRKRRLLPSESVYYVAFLRKCELHFSKEHKRRLWTWFKKTQPDHLLTATCELSPGVHIKPGELIDAVYKRVNWYSRARDRWIEANPDIKGGTPVIRGTRMSVYSVAGRLNHGESIDQILEDNPDIPPEAIEAAQTFADANPLVGRPGGRPWRE